ncbi:hypothetical protein [Treponema sp. R6D11]
MEFRRATFLTREETLAEAFELGRSLREEGYKREDIFGLETPYDTSYQQIAIPEREIEALCNEIYGQTKKFFGEEFAERLISRAKSVAWFYVTPEKSSFAHTDVVKNSKYNELHFLCGGIRAIYGEENTLSLRRIDDFAHEAYHIATTEHATRTSRDPCVDDEVYQKCGLRLTKHKWAGHRVQEAHYNLGLGMEEGLATAFSNFVTSKYSGTLEYEAHMSQKAEAIRRGVLNERYATASKNIEYLRTSNKKVFDGLVDLAFDQDVGRYAQIRNKSGIDWSTITSGNEIQTAIRLLFLELDRSVSMDPGPKSNVLIAKKLGF